MDGNIKCPVCREYFELEDDLEKGEITSCPRCYEDLEVISINPLRIESIGEDLYDEDKYYDEEDENYRTKKGKQEWT